MYEHPPPPTCPKNHVIMRFKEGDHYGSLLVWCGKSWHVLMSGATRHQLDQYFATLQGMLDSVIAQTAAELSRDRLRASNESGRATELSGYEAWACEV